MFRGSLILEWLFVCFIVQPSWSSLVGTDCLINTCPFEAGCVANAPNADGYVCICRLFHMRQNMTWKTNYTACSSDYSPWGTYPIEDGVRVEDPFFDYERLPDISFTASGHYQDFRPNYARIKTNEQRKGAWCAPTDVGTAHWLQIDLGAKNKVTAVGTQARAAVSVAISVKSYNMAISDDNITFAQIMDGSSPREFVGNLVKDLEVINFFDPPIETRFLRFYPIADGGLQCIRVEIYGLKLINECENGWNQCDSLATCTDTIPSYFCTCPTGYQDIIGNGFVCIQVNECQNRRPEFRHNCSANADCADADGGFTCTCHDGYRGDGYYCEDTDECVDGNYVCHEKAHCVNKIGSYSCVCNVGYTGDGLNKCDDEDECKKTHDCHAEAKCVNTIGSYLCQCRPDYAGSGKICYDVNECKYDPPPCHEFATCSNTIGSFACTCNPGFEGSGLWCQDINECEVLGRYCSFEERCFNYPGGFLCTCPAHLPNQRPYEATERQIMDSMLDTFRDNSKQDWKYPLDYHAHLLRTIYQIVMRTYNYHFQEVGYSFFMSKVAGNDFSVEVYDFRCTDVGNVSFPNFCHAGYSASELRFFTDVVDMWLIREPIASFEQWATEAPLVVDEVDQPITTEATTAASTKPAPTTRIMLVNGTNVTITEAPPTTPPPFYNCGGHFKAKHGYLMTPNYPSRYPANSKCVWIIEAPESYNVYVKFNSFKLELDRKCFYDYVEIREASEHGELLARYCGSKTPIPVRSVRNRLVVIFYSDYNQQHVGFDAEWDVLSPRVSLTCIAYNQMSTMPSSYVQTWRESIEDETDKSSYVPISRLLACKQYPKCNHTRPRDVLFTLEHFRRDRNVKICIHYMLDKIGTTWKTRPCKILKTNKTHTICSCHTWGIVGVLGKYQRWTPEQNIGLFTHKKEHNVNDQEGMKDMGSDASDNEKEEESDVPMETVGQDDLLELDEKPKRNKFRHVRDGSAIFLKQIKDGDESDDDVDITNETGLDDTCVDEPAPLNLDNEPEDSDSDSDQEIMFRYDELAAMRQNNRQEEEIRIDI